MLNCVQQFLKFLGLWFEFGKNILLVMEIKDWNCEVDEGVICRFKDKNREGGGRMKEKRERGAMKKRFWLSMWKLEN